MEAPDVGRYVRKSCKQKFHVTARIACNGLVQVRSLDRTGSIRPPESARSAKSRMQGQVEGTLWISGLLKKFQSFWRDFGKHRRRIRVERFAINQTVGRVGNVTIKH